MTEIEWFACTELKEMMESVQGRLSERKLILFGCACCCRHWRIIPDGPCKNAVESAERFADGLCDTRELRRAREQVKEAYPYLFWYQDFGCHAEAASYYAAFDACAAKEMQAEHPLDGPGDYLTVIKYSEVAGGVASAVSLPHSPTFQEDWNREMVAQCAILRDIVGNPFRRVPVEPFWLTPTVKAMAHAIYDGRRFEQMRILGDTLEEAGCMDADLVGHCRHSALHVRGCWVIDLLLGKE